MFAFTVCSCVSWLRKIKVNWIFILSRCFLNRKQQLDDAEVVVDSRVYFLFGGNLGVLLHIHIIIIIIMAKIQFSLFDIVFFSFSRVALALHFVAFLFIYFLLLCHALFYSNMLHFHKSKSRCFCAAAVAAAAWKLLILAFCWVRLRIQNTGPQTQSSSHKIQSGLKLN